MFVGNLKVLMTFALALVGATFVRFVFVLLIADTLGAATFFYLRLFITSSFSSLESNCKL